jgi:GWxTD domain-containing protein
MMLRRALPFALFLTAAAIPAALAEKLDKEDKRWLEEVAPLMLLEEEKAFRALKDKADRQEFQKIFWARRNPSGPAAADNPAKADYDKLRPQLEQRFKSGGTPGTATDCARVSVLLGEPNETRREVPDGGGVPGQVWTYKDRPGYTFVGGQIEVFFAANCSLHGGAGFREQLNRPAEARIVSPNIGYKTGRDGRLVKLAEQLPKPSPAQTLLKEPRQDYPLAAENKLVMRGREGATYVAGLVRGDGAGLGAQEQGGKKTVTVVVAAAAVDASGNMVASQEQETAIDVAADGFFVGSYGLTLKPGSYTIRAGALDPKSGKGAASSAPLEVPDLAGGELSIADLVILQDVVQKQTQDARDPLASFFMGTAQFVPRFANAFKASESLQVLGLVYNGKTDPATGKANVACRFAILKDGNPITRTPEDQVFEEPLATPGIGPVPLAQFKPGKYAVQLKVVDKVAQKDYVKETAFEVLP